MANQIADNLGTISSIYYAAVHPTQVHPFYNRLVYNTYGSNKLLMWLDMKSKRVNKPAMTFLHLENDRMQLPITTSGGSGAAGAAVNLTITSGYLNSGTYSPVQPKYKIYDGTNYFTVNTVNTAVPNAFVMNVSPDVNTVAVNVASGQLLFILKAAAVIEGSSATQNSLMGDGVVFTNTIQEFRRDEKITGQALAQFSSQVTFWDYVNPITNQQDKLWYNAELDRIQLEFINNREVYGITGQQVTNPTIQAANGLGTTGVIPAIKAYGNLKNYSKVAGFQISDFQDMTVTMEKNQSLREYQIWDGVELDNDLQNTLKDFFPNGAISYGSFSGGKDEAIGFGFTSISMYNRTWHLHDMEIFNRPDFLGAAFNSGDYIGSAIVLPSGSTIGEKGQAVDYIGRATLEGNGFEYGYDHWVVDGMGWFTGMPFARPTTERAVTFCWADAFGMEINAAKQLFYIQRTN